MILYFSATGNCKYAAERISAVTGDEMVSVTDAVNNGKFVFEDEIIGIVTPTYFWGLPSIVYEFLSRAELRAEYIWFTATYGTTTGGCGYFANKCLGGKINAFFSVRMADTWTVWFDLSTPEAVAKYTKDTEKEIDTVIAAINERKSGNYIKKKVPAIIAKIAYSTYDGARATKKLSTNDNCIGCGLCAKKCPVKAIEMRNGRPVWVKDKCAMCFGCLHSCPKHSIRYGNGKATDKHGQYRNPDVDI